MASKLRKPKSKRLTAHKKHAISKRAAKAKSKLRCLQKKHTFTKMKKLNVIKIPNRVPYKSELLAEMERNRVQEQEERQKKLQAYIAKEQKRIKEKNKEKMVPRSVKVASSVQVPLLPSKKTHTKVINDSDIVLQVVDVRDPAGFLSGDVFTQCKEKNKVLINVVTKLDLVPRSAAVDAFKYLSTLPTPFVAVRPVLFNSKTIDYRKVGFEGLLSEINKLSGGVNKTIGVVGYPGCGKTAIISTIQGDKNPSGSSRTIQINGGNKLILDDGTTTLAKDLKVLLRNFNTVYQVKGIAAVKEILRHVSKTELITFYRIPDFKSVKEFLKHVADAKGKKMKGGIPDTNAAAHLFIKDWYDGKFTYVLKSFELPDTFEENDAFKAAMGILEQITSRPEVSATEEAEGLEDEEDEDEEEASDEDEDEDVDEEETAPKKATKSKKQKVETENMEEEEEEEEEEDNEDENADYDITKYF